MNRCVSLAAIFVLALPVAAAEPAVTFGKEKDRLRIAIGGKPFAEYVHVDPAIPRAYFAHLHAPDGTQVTRNQPPVKGKDRDDHPVYHPGVWLALSQLSGADFWRNKGKIELDSYAAEPKGGAGEGAFTVVHRWNSRGKTIAKETARYRILVRPAGYLLLIESLFKSANGPLVFGDEEEMGLGIRVATPLAVVAGGRMLDSAGRANEKGIWGKSADWCDCFREQDGKRVGLMVMAAPDNFRPCWIHARDYGVVIANPFGKKAYTGGAPSRIEVPELRLRFGVLAHAEDASKPLDRAAIWKDFVELLKVP